MRYIEKCVLLTGGLEDSFSIYELLIAGLIDLVYQSGAYEAFADVWANIGKMAFISGKKREKANF